MAKATPGISERHSRPCRERGGACICTPGYVPWVFDQRTHTKRYATPATFTGKGALAAAKAWRADALGQVKRGTLPVTNKRTLEQEAEAWITRAEKGEVRTRSGAPFKPSVTRGYVQDLRNHVLPTLGYVRVSQLHRRDVQGLVDKMAADGLSGSRIRGTVNALRAVLRRPLQHDELVRNPTSLLDLPAGASSRERAASPAEAAELLAALPDDVRPVYATAFYAGLRRGELRALRVSDLSEGLTEINVSRSWDDVAGEIAPKSKAGTRRVPVAGTLRLVLLEQLARTGRRGDELVFGRTATQPFTPTHVRKQALAAWTAENVDRAEKKQPPLEPIGLHECRHTYVSLLHAAGVPLETIGDLVGHSGAYMTDKYRHLLDASRTDAGTALDSYLTAGTVTLTGTRTLAVAATPHG